MKHENELHGRLELTSLRLTPEERKLKYCESKIQRIAVGLMPPPFGVGLSISFGTRDMGTVHAEWDESAWLPLAAKLREEVAKSPASAASITQSRLSISTALDGATLSASAIQYDRERDTLELRLVFADVVARVTLDRRRAKTLTELVEQLKPGPKNVRIIS